MPRASALFIFSLLVNSLHGIEHDLVIRRARLIDGSGSPAVLGDIAVDGDRIAAIGQLTATGRLEIDAQGRAVTPGFIDVHTHSEDIMDLPEAENFLRMGVTTIVTGNCGTSRTDIADFFAAIARARVALNIATLIGQGSVRGQVMGGSFMRPATAAELERMRALVDQGMRDGAVGLSTGLIYLPGTYTKTEELIELAKVTAAHGGLYASHMRAETIKIFDALEELTRIAREAKIRAQVSHIKLSGPAAWGRASEVVHLLSRARAEGLDVAQDQYVYTASSTGIATLVPSEAREGGNDRFRARIRDPEQKAAIVTEMKRTIAAGKRGDYSYAVIANYPRNRSLNGKTVRQAAQILRQSDTLDDQIEVVLEIAANGGAQGVFHGMSEADLRVFLTQPQTMMASDAGPRKFGEAVPHPRGYGNNARVLGHYVRELKLLSLEEAVRKMTSLPAQTFRLKNRGVLKPGHIADIVIFDPAVVSDPSSFNDPHHYATGFSDVIVNGVPVIRNSILTGARPGRPVRLTER